MRFAYRGKEYEFRGEYRLPRQGQDYLHPSGSVMEAAADHGRGDDIARAIVHPVPKEWTFGGVVYEEGEARAIQHDEYWLSGTMLGYWPHHEPTAGVFPVLRPVRIVREEPND